MFIGGGDDAGTGAAWAAGHLQLRALLALQHARELGGDLTNCIPSDISVDAQRIGGINGAYDTFARVRTGQPSGAPRAGMPGRVAPPGPSFAFLASMLRNFSTLSFAVGGIPVAAATDGASPTGLRTY